MRRGSFLPRLSDQAPINNARNMGTPWPATLFQR